MKPVLGEDVEAVLHAEFIPWERLEGKTIFISGGTGLIGFHLANAILHANKVRRLGLRLLLLVRNREKAEWLYRDFLQEEGLQFLPGDVVSLPFVLGAVDYIVHGAGITDSRRMIEEPVETIWTTMQGTRNMLELAREKNVSGMVFLSSMETYGNQHSEEPLREDEDARLSSGNLRDCYPISKVAAESLCLAYGKEYGVRASCLRLSQTLGYMERQGRVQDRKIIQEILDDLREGKDICLLTKGESKRTYLYIRDAVSAILAVLLYDGEPGIFNAANEKSYSSVYELCEMAAHELAHDKIKVVVEGKELPQFPRTNFLNLSSDKLRELGWSPSVGLREMLERMLDSGQQ